MQSSMQANDQKYIVCRTPAFLCPLHRLRAGHLELNVEVEFKSCLSNVHWVSRAQKLKSMVTVAQPVYDMNATSVRRSFSLSISPCASIPPFPHLRLWSQLTRTSRGLASKSSGQRVFSVLEHVVGECERVCSTRACSAASSASTSPSTSSTRSHRAGR